MTVAGTFLGWFEFSSGSGVETIKGWDLATSKSIPFTSKDPYTLLALAAFGAVVGVLLLIGKLRPLARAAAVVVGAAIIALVVRDWLTASDLVKAQPGWKLSQQVGFFVPIAGGAIIAVAAVLPAKK